jgi:hypothetical protein
VTSCQFNATLNGIGDFVVASAATGHATPEQSNVIDGKIYAYYAASYDSAVPPNVTAWEAGSGAYTILTHTQHRTTITANSDGTTIPVNFPTPPIVNVYASPSGSLESSRSGGDISNLISYASGANTISITADVVSLYDASGNMYGAISISLTLNLATSGANGLDSGSVSTQGYYYFVIYNATTNTVASLASASLTPTMPTGYTFKRRIGWFSYNSGIAPFTQRNRSFAYRTSVTIASGTFTAQYFSLSGIIPPQAGLVRLQIVSNNNTVLVGDSIGQTIVNIAAIGSGQCFWYGEFVMQVGSLQLYFSSNSGGGSIGVQGWDDNI